MKDREVTIVLSECWNWTKPEIILFRAEHKLQQTGEGISKHQPICKLGHATLCNYTFHSPKEKRENFSPNQKEMKTLLERLA